MLKQGLFEVKENKKIAKSVYKMTLSGDASAIENPGQFINIKLDGFFLRRPISICDVCGELCGKNPCRARNRAFERD